MANSLTYPAPALSGAGSLTTEQIHQILRSDELIARRVRELASQKFIADALLTGRYKSVGGVALYETGEPVETSDAFEAIAAGGEYPRSQAYTGDLATAQVSKWGRDIPVTDESIARRGFDPVERAFNQLVARLVRQVDSSALGVIASKVTATSASTGAWTTAKAIVESVETAKAVAEESGEGHTLDTVVLTPTQYAKVMAAFLDAGLLPREASNPLLTGAWPQVLDLTWLRSPHTPTTAPMLVDTAELGGMADEALGGPGYSESLPGLETKSIRREETDSYLLRARRSTVPIVTDPGAGVLITGTSL